MPTRVRLDSTKSARILLWSTWMPSTLSSISELNAGWSLVVIMWGNIPRLLCGARGNRGMTAFVRAREGHTARFMAETRGNGVAAMRAWGWTFAGRSGSQRGPATCHQVWSPAMNAPRIARLSVAALVLLSGTALADLTGSYTTPNVTLTLTESQTKAGGHIDGTLRIADKEFPISGDVAGDSATGKLGSEGDALDCTLRSTDAGLELRSGGYIVQLARAGSSKPNPLSAIGESRGEPEVSSAVAARLPAVFTASLGFTLRHPAEWRERDVKGVGALVPDDAPQVQGQLGEMYALAAMPRGTLTASGLGQRLQSEMAAALPGMTQTGEAEMRNGGVTLRYQGPDSGGVRAASTVRATIKGDLIVVMMGLGAEEALRKHDSLAADVFATVGAAPRAS